MRSLGRLSLVLLVLFLIGACGSDTPESQTVPETSAIPTVSPDEDDTPGEPVTPGGGMAAMCVETYSLDTLEKREFAFDGTARSVEAPADQDDPQRVTFEVHEWFKGGDGDEATIEASGFAAGTISSVGGGWKIGDRLLVAGEDDILWECGFTQAYDADVAAEWERALGG